MEIKLPMTAILKAWLDRDLATDLCSEPCNECTPEEAEVIGLMTVAFPVGQAALWFCETQEQN
jgi:hypothetical protein